MPKCTVELTLDCKFKRDLTDSEVQELQSIILEFPQGKPANDVKVTSRNLVIERNRVKCNLTYENTYEQYHLITDFINDIGIDKDVYYIGGLTTKEGGKEIHATLRQKDGKLVAIDTAKEKQVVSWIKNFAFR